MSGFSSPPRFLPPGSPRRVPSPTMSPGGRRGRGTGTSDESHLRDLSPSSTLRAFTERPIPFDVSRDEYKIFACIDHLTVAERDLGARVAKAAQRLKSWCQEIQQWGWSGSFEAPDETFRDERRRSLELRIREHVTDSDVIDSIGPLEYWGSLLSVDVQAHEARLDEIGEELLELDIEELKEHVLDIHGSSRSRPSSAGYQASRRDYTPMDDFSFLITQTLLSALPQHFQLKDRLNAWTARVTVLREAPQYLDDLQTAQRAMKLGWNAIGPPTDPSDAAFEKWKEAVDTISGVLHGKVSELGQRLDRMLDTLEGREDCLPDTWIEIFEGVEADFGQWAQESRKRIIEVDVQRHREQTRFEPSHEELLEEPVAHPDDISTLEREPVTPNDTTTTTGNLAPIEIQTHSVTALLRDVPSEPTQQLEPAITGPATTEPTHPRSLDENTPTSEELDFEDGDTIIHNELEQHDDSAPPMTSFIPVQQNTDAFADSPVIITTDADPIKETAFERPETPRSRRDSTASIDSNTSFSSSPPSIIEDSPSVRNANRHARTPRPALNAAMGKRRPAKNAKGLKIDNDPPWPPTQFSKQVSPNSADDLDRKISDILTTIPAHIRLTSGPASDSPEVKPTRGGNNNSNKGSKGYLRAARSINGLKSPELTLSPAKQDFGSTSTASGRKSSAALRGDNDIKLYHLKEPGREHPIKLFIRRVGENGERVMVRVGGGWADLGEYLRQYAEHHGRRAVSDGKFEILGLEVKNPESPRTESAMGKRDRRFSGGTHTGSPSSTPQKPIDVDTVKEEAPPSMPSLTSTPVGLSGETSAPSTGSSRQSWTGKEVGLAGPKTRKLDLSGEKLEWIEGMMKQARSVSGNLASGTKTEHSAGHQRDGTDSRSDSRSGVRKPEFGDLGKVGGTKRLFLRGGGLSEH